MAVTRRRFLAGVAAVPFAARLDAQSLLSSKPRVAVIGAGAFGGWTALELRRLGADVVLVDRWGPGNSLSSSGGKTRVIRAIYGPDRIYSEMVKRAFELWKTVDVSKSDPLYVEMGALWMHRGDDAYVRAAVPILHDLGFVVDQLSIPEAVKKYPQIDFNGVKSVWLERKAGAIYSRHACAVVRDMVAKAGGHYRQSSVKPGPIVNGKMSDVRLEDGSKLRADVFVFALGPWLGKVFPEVIGDRVHPTRQEVYYVATPKGSDRYTANRLPIWIDFGKRIVYGIPDVNGRWLKVADDTRGEPIDPTTADRHPKKEKVESARQFLAERFPEIAGQPLLSAEVCQYENSPDGNLIIDRHPSVSNVWLLGGGSGHGFKLAPVVGEMTAQAIVSGQGIPAVFHLDRLRDVAKPKTQFEIKKS